MVEQKHRQDVTSIVRLAGRDVDGSFKIQKALSKIKGMGNTMAHSVAVMAEQKLGIARSTSVGSLSEEQIAKLEDLVKDPQKAGVYTYLLNRRKDVEKGVDMHLVGTDLIVSTRQDIERDMKSGSWRGHRHQYGQRVRGQKSRSTGRTGTTVGVTKGKGNVAPSAQAAKTAAAAPQKQTKKK